MCAGSGGERELRGRLPTSAPSPSLSPSVISVYVLYHCLTDLPKNREVDGQSGAGRSGQAGPCSGASPGCPCPISRPPCIHSSTIYRDDVISGAIYPYRAKMERGARRPVPSPSAAFWRPQHSTFQDSLPTWSKSFYVRVGAAMIAQGTSRPGAVAGSDGHLFSTVAAHCSRLCVQLHCE